MNDLKLSAEDKADLINRISMLCDTDVLRKEDYAVILCACKTACERRMKEIEKVIGKQCDIVQ